VSALQISKTVLSWQGCSLTLTNKLGQTVLDLAKDDNSLIALVEDELELREREAQEGRGGWW